MPKVMLEMEMPKSCSNCKYKEGGYTDERYTCKLTNITFPAEYISREESFDNGRPDAR